MIEVSNPTDTDERAWGYRRWLVQCLAEGLLRRYNVTAPPVPVESMLADVHQELWPADPEWQVRTRGSLGPKFRVEAAKKLFSHLRQSERGREIALDSRSYADLGLLFARCLLMPSRWLESLEVRDVIEVSELYRVPPDMAAMRLIELGLWSEN